MDYKLKYSKYKQKYFNLLNQSGGGLCTKCGKRPANPGHSWCEQCYRQNLAPLRICTKCGKYPANSGRSWCEQCYRQSLAPTQPIQQTHQIQSMRDKHRELIAKYPTRSEFYNWLFGVSIITPSTFRHFEDAKDDKYYNGTNVFNANIFSGNTLILNYIAYANNITISQLLNYIKIKNIDRTNDGIVIKNSTIIDPLQFSELNEWIRKTLLQNLQ